MNFCILLGNLTRDPELRYLPNNNMPLCSFGIACNKKWKDRDGNSKEEVMFVDCTAFGKTAELINQYFSKGSQILINGRLKFEQWETDGQKRSRHTVVAESFSFTGRASDKEAKPQASPKQASIATVPEDGIPF